MEAAVELEATQPENLIKYRVSADKVRAEVLIPGLNYMDFKTMDGRWTYWSIAKTFEGIRYSALPKGFLDYNRFRDGKHSMFLASGRAEFSPLLHNIRGRTHWGVKFPIYCTLHLTHIGTSSFTFKTTLYNGQTGDKLGSNLTRFVYINMQTRKPDALPDWFIDFGKTNTFLSQPTDTIERPDRLVIPDDAFKYHVRATYSDIDSNGHVNQSIFVRWCADAGAEAALKGSYSNFTKDIGLYPLKTMFVQYVGEALVNEDVVVNTWEENMSRDESQILHFNIEKNGKPIFIAMFAYYSNGTADTPGSNL